MRSGRRRGATALLVLVVIAAVAGYLYGSTRGGSSQAPSSQAPVKAHPRPPRAKRHSALIWAPSSSTV